MLSLVILVSNLHCPSCVCHIEDVLATVPGITTRPDVSLIAQTIKVKYDDKITNRGVIINALIAAAFEVQHVAVYDHAGKIINEYDLSSTEKDQAIPQNVGKRQVHVQNCEACQQEVKHDQDSATRYDSCTSTGFESLEKPAIITIDEPKEAESLEYVATISIQGMTCGSCVGTIATGLEALQYVLHTSVDLLGNAATVEFRGRDHLEQILETIDDLGYDGTLVELSELKQHGETGPSQERLIEIEVDGMHCTHCPDRIVHNLEEFRTSLDSGSKGFNIAKSPSLKVPRIQIRYIPSRSEGITVRNFISIIKSIDPAFSASIYHPPTLEERSRSLQNKERLAILLRLVFTGLVAIPAFILGVVYMSLVPSHNTTRIWFTEPMWAGDASRLEWALFIMTTPVMFFGADTFHRRAFKEIWAMWRPKSVTPLLRRFYRFGSMNMLISVGTLVAYVSSLAVLIVNSSSKPSETAQDSRMSATYFDVITFLTFFILIGKFLEAYSKAKAGDTVAMLSHLKPKVALLVEDGSVRQIPVDYLEVGDLVQIPRGHSPPADGVIKQDGSFSFDESSLTGESKPVSKIAGKSVFTGTVNVADPVEVQITELNGSSMLDQIIDVVRSGQAQRAPVERVADILTGYFVPVVTLIAIVTWVIWLSLGLSGRLPSAWLDTPRGGWAFWSLEFAIAVFVIACPCGIGLAAPTALFVGGGLAAKQGILAQGGGQAFQEASNLNTIVFDKTGTLTQGQMKVVRCDHLSDKLSGPTVFAVSKALEESSSHPIAQAVTEFCSSSTETIAITNTKEFPGYGMAATIKIGAATQQRTFEAAIGNEKLIDLMNASDNSSSNSHSDSQGVDQAGTPLQQILYQYQSKGHSLAILSVREQGQFEAIAVFALADPLRTEAYEVVASMRALKLSVHLCTGDNYATAVAIASQLNIPIENVRADVLPQGKAEYIRQLQHPHDHSRRLVAFVGDGVNDTPALTAADVSISLSSGSDIAINASSFILLNSHLSAIHDLVTLSRRVFRRVKINFFWAAIYNVTLIPIAAGVLFAVGATESHGGFRLSPVWASVAMAGSSVSVVLSSLALKLPAMRWSRDKS